MPHKTQEVKKALYTLLSPERIASLLARDTSLAMKEVEEMCRRITTSGSLRIESRAERDALVRQVVDEILGLGAVESMLSDDSITEIMVNGQLRLRQQLAGGPERG
jgi:pilus assembly protein CpaF